MDTPTPPEHAADAYRERVRDWLAEQAPQHGWLRDQLVVAAHEEADDETRLGQARDCQRRLFEAGFAGIAWPREYGGRGLTNREQAIFNQEAAAYELPLGLYLVGLGMCGPCILTMGTEEQKQRYIPPMLRGDEIWCQMFSEPGAGSDVAGLETRAVPDGDGWVIRGQKVWTSSAQFARYGILLTRTDPDVPKHQGLTMFVLDMRAPGVTVEPLRQMNGVARFNEVFLDDVRVAGGDVLGEVGGGWQAAIATLMNERVSIGTGRPARYAHDAATLAEAAGRSGLAGDPNLREALVDLYIHERVLGFLSDKIADTVLAGKVPGPEGSLAKLAGSQIAKRSADLGIAILGMRGIAWDAGDTEARRWANVLLASPGLSLAGGTDEVLRNIVGERILGLPKEPDVERGLTFREVRDRLHAKGSGTWEPSGAAGDG